MREQKNDVTVGDSSQSSPGSDVKEVSKRSWDFFSCWFLGSSLCHQAQWQAFYAPSQLIGFLLLS